MYAYAFYPRFFFANQLLVCPCPISYLPKSWYIFVLDLHLSTLYLDFQLDITDHQAHGLCYD